MPTTTRSRGATMTTRKALAVAAALLGDKATVRDDGPCEMMPEELRRAFIGPPRLRCTGYLYHDGHPSDCTGGAGRFNVGRVEMGLFNMILGHGRTWDEALASAAHHHCAKCDRATCEKSKKLRRAYLAAKVRMPSGEV
jgi:hypothetical protein